MKNVWLRCLILGLFVGMTSACTTISDFFADDEELEIKRLDPIVQKFEIEPVWDTTVGDGAESYFSRLKPVVNGEITYIAERQGYLVALDTNSGKTIWQLDFATYSDEGWFSGFNQLFSRGQSARLSSLTYDNNTLYLGSENGDFMALEPKDGTIKWQTTVPGEILAPAAIDGRLVIINTGRGMLFALNTESGEEIWRSESDVPPLSLRGISAPSTASGGVVVGTPTGYLKVNVLDSGLTAWETAIAKPTGATELERIVDIDASPLVYGNVVYAISYNGTLASVELRSGRVIWKREYGSYRNMTLSGNTLFVVDANSNVLALDRRNGIERWTQSGIKNRGLTSAVPFGEHVVVGDNYGFLHWINAESGEIESRFDLGGNDEDASIFSDPVVANNTLIAVTRNGTVAALKPINN